MPPAIIGLGNVFSDKVVGQMAVHAQRRLVMAGFLPGIELGPHDMAIGADLGLCTDVREPLGIMKGIHDDPDEYPNQNGCQYSCHGPVGEWLLLKS